MFCGQMETRTQARVKFLKTLSPRPSPTSNSSEPEYCASVAGYPCICDASLIQLSPALATVLNQNMICLSAGKIVFW